MEMGPTWHQCGPVFLIQKTQKHNNTAKKSFLEAKHCLGQPVYRGRGCSSRQPTKRREHNPELKEVVAHLRYVFKLQNTSDCLIAGCVPIDGNCKW